MNAVEKILRVQRLLSNLPAQWTAGRGRPSSGQARERCLVRFLNPPRRGRPAKGSYSETRQLQFPFD
jgi:hypothetical protein